VLNGEASTLAAVENGILHLNSRSKFIPR